MRPISRSSQNIPLLPLTATNSDEAITPVPSIQHGDLQATDTLHTVSVDALPSTSMERQPSSASSISIDSVEKKDQTSQPLRLFADKLKNLIERLNSMYSTWLQGSRFYGWRMGVLVGTCMSSLVLICNIAVVIVGARSHGGYHQGIADLAYGQASHISRLSTLLHLLINAASTILLGASNYTMQVLCSPTRHDIDIAHARGNWLEIGLLSFRNLRSIPGSRAALWLVLALSSLPLHLL